jgi:hypothetical protein
MVTDLLHVKVANSSIILLIGGAYDATKWTAAFNKSLQKSSVIISGLIVAVLVRLRLVG